MKLVNSCSISENCSSWHVVQPENGKLLIFCSFPSCKRNTVAFTKIIFTMGVWYNSQSIRLHVLAYLTMKTSSAASVMARKTDPPGQSAHKNRTHCLKCEPNSFRGLGLDFRLHFQTERERQLTSQKTWFGGMGFETSAPS